VVFYSVGSLAMFVFLLYCVLDVILTEAGLIRNLPKLTWLLLVVFLPLVGGIAWLVAGRPGSAGAAPGSSSSRRPDGYRSSTRGNPVHRPPPVPPPGGNPRRARPAAPRGPDDDPAFLAELERRLRPPDEGASRDPDAGR
jgi:hypothetical protein